MKNFNELMRNISNQEAAQRQRLQDDANSRLQAKKEKDDILKEMMESVGIVAELQSVNHQIWMSLGVLEISDAEASLVFKGQYHAPETRVVDKKVFGTYQTASNSSDPRNYSIDYRTEKGWHRVLVGHEVTGIKTTPSPSAQRASMLYVEYPNRLAIDLKDTEVYVSPGPKYGGKHFTLESGDMNSQGVDSVIKAWDSGALRVHFRNTELGISQARTNLALGLAWLNMQRLEDGHLPQDIKAEQDKRYQKLQGQIGKFI